MNLDHDTEEDVQVIILVEDSRFYSSYLPMIYTCLIEQNRSISGGFEQLGKTSGCAAL